VNPPYRVNDGKNSVCNCRFACFFLRILRQVERKINNVINNQKINIEITEKIAKDNKAYYGNLKPIK
jgi:hypothetical protein